MAPRSPDLAGARRALRRLRQQGLRGWLDLERDTLVLLAKAALASGLGYAAATLLGSGFPVLAALAGLLAVRATVYASLRGAVQTAAGVVVGVNAALVAGAVLGLSAGTITLVVFAALLLGRALRLGAQSNEVAVSALLVLGLGAAYAGARLVDTLVGALVGLAVNALVAPPQLVEDAGRSLRSAAEDLAICLREVADGLERRWDLEDARGWLAQARELSVGVREATEAVERGSESLRYNPLAGGDAENVARFTEARAALEHSVNTVRGVARVLTDVAEVAPSAAERRAAFAPFAPMLRALADAVSAFGRLQVAREVTWTRNRTELDEALTLAARHRDEVSAALRREELDRSVARMRTALLVDVQRLLSEFDPHDGAHTAAVPAVAPPPP